MSKKILFVDDEEVLLDIYKSYLERKGYTVLCASRGEKGLEILQQQDVDLLILDLRFKEGISGIEVLKRVRVMKPDLKILVFTGLIYEQDIVDLATKLGATKIINKAISIEKLKNEIDTLLQ